MSDLQIGLISLGILLILVVVCVNWWQDRRVRRRMQEHFPETDHDPLMGTAVAGRREPGLGLGATASHDTDEVDEVDPACEAVIDVSFAHAVSGHDLHEVLQTILTNVGKPVRVFAESDSGKHHMRLREEESYVCVQLAVLLANRSGPLTDIEWSLLWTIAQRLAERFDGAVEGPEQHEVLQRAQQLDQTCASLDAQVALALKLNGPQPLDDVLAVVQEAGFLPYGKQLAWMADSGMARFTVLFDGRRANDVPSENVGQLDLLLDLPKTTRDEQAFSRMASVGRDLAGRLNAVLVDDQGRPLVDGADETLDEQLLTLYDNLDRAGFPAGTQRTVRLFS